MAEVSDEDRVLRDFPLTELRLIEWMDSVATGGWHSPIEPPRSPWPCRSIGWVLEDTDEYVTLVQTTTAEHWTDAMSIPQGAIQRQWTLVDD